MGKGKHKHGGQEPASSSKAPGHGRRRSSGGDKSTGSTLASLPSIHSSDSFEISSPGSGGSGERKSACPASGRRGTGQTNSSSYSSGESTAPTLTSRHGRHSISDSGDAAGDEWAAADSSRNIAALIDAIQEARIGKRTALLEKLADKYLHKSYLPEAVDKCKETLCSVLLSSIVKANRAGAKEAVLSSRLLGAVLLTIGKDKLPVGLFEQICDKLQRTYKTHALPQIRGSAAELYALLVFVGCNDDSKQEEALLWFSNCAGAADFSTPDDSESSADLAATLGLLSGFSLLATLLPSRQLANFDDEPGTTLWEFGSRCLEQTECSMRCAVSRPSTMTQG
eukprot:GHVT01029076.1.p1 GENE.GHVT01029076.1~~GHVT01029076.1.p1  ORF type:complete len:339 (+),score=31.80 GHVT01029076.1:519-1535(+)